MIFAYILFLALGISAFLLLGKLGMPTRIGLALAIFLIPSIAVTAWVSYVGDKPPRDAETIAPETRHPADD